MNERAQTWLMYNLINDTIVKKPKLQKKITFVSPVRKPLPPDPFPEPDTEAWH
jgi:hypothetical protein